MQTGDEVTLVEIVRRRAASEGERIAYVFLVDGERDEQTLTYAELEAGARRVAVALAARGAEGSAALLLFDPGLDFIVALFGCFFAGVMAVPVTALLALTEGGYAVEVDNGDGTTRLIGVDPGLYADNLVEVASSGLQVGDLVVVP